MMPAIASDEIASTSSIAHTRLFVASPTMPALHSPRRSSWSRLPFARCSCGRRAGTLDVAVAGRCSAADGGCGVTTAGEGRHQFELDRLSPSVGRVATAQCRRLSADDVGEPNGGVLVETATMSDARRRGIVDEPVYLPLGRAPSIDHYFRCSVTGPDHALISDSRFHDNPDLLFAS